MGATQLHVDPRFAGEKFDAVIFNNPHIRVPKVGSINRRLTDTETGGLIQQVGRSTWPLLKPNGEIHINLTRTMAANLANSLKGQNPLVRRSFVQSFSESDYFAPYIPLYSSNRRFYEDVFAEPEDAGKLLSFVFVKGN